MIPLQSGSNGNSIFVESDGIRLLFDAGITGTQASQRLMRHGIDPATIHGLFISHDHADHVKGVGVFTRKFGLPLHITERTFAVAKRRMALGEITDVRTFRAGSSIKVGHVTVETVATPHDAVDGVVFVVDDGRHRLGICTDVGHVYGDLRSLVANVDGLYLESNYDVAMLENGHYPRSLKRRIAGPGGHISNLDAAELLAGHATDRLQWVCLAHLSAENNTPALTLETHRRILGTSLHLQIANRYDVTPAMALGETFLAPAKPRIPKPKVGFGFDDELPAQPPSRRPRRVRDEAPPSVADQIFAR